MSGIFVSHASADDGFVAELRSRLEEHSHEMWVDSRQLRGGDQLSPQIERAIAEAQQVIVVLSPATVNSPWVVREVRHALAVKERRGDQYRVIPLLLPGITVSALGMWFGEQEPVAVEIGPDGLVAAIPQSCSAALGDRLPTDPEEFTTPTAGVVEELILRLTGPRIIAQDGMRRAWAVGQLVYEPAGLGRPPVEGRPFAFAGPIGPIEIDDLRWYLENYWLWPVGVFRERAAFVEDRLPQWGQALLAAVQDDEGEAFAAWQRAGRTGALRRFTVKVDNSPSVEPAPEAEPDLDAEAGPARQGTPMNVIDGNRTPIAEQVVGGAAEAAMQLLELPWELLHDGDTWLFQGRNPVRVRRQLPNRADMVDQHGGLPIRILLVSPRPDRSTSGDSIGYIDHRASALPLLEAIENLGELARLTVLTPPTYAALERALAEGDQGQPFDVVHFDGHGVYDRRHGLGGLCFERPQDQPSREPRVLDLVYADRLGGLVRDYRIPLVFLDACQTAAADVDPTASVAVQLLDKGVASVVAMTHSVLVATARRFVQAFYRELAAGARVGTAMLAGQRALFADPYRGRILGAGELRLHDWFVPVLYQERLDPQPITRLPAPTVARLAQQGRKLRLGELPGPPEHQFQGRSRELLSLERHLHDKQWAVVRGTGGQGKTTLAVELARWLQRTRRAERVIFVNLELHRDPRAVLDSIGRQLVPGYSIAIYPDLRQARLPVERALDDQQVLLVIDNCETVLPNPAFTDLPPATDQPGDEPVHAAVTADSVEDSSAAIFTLFQDLLDARTGIQVVFTTREPLPAPFARRDHEWLLGALSRNDAIELVGKVMTQNGWTLPSSDDGAAPEEITDLVETVHGHPRALVLLAREIAERGLQTTTSDLRALMAQLDRDHPEERENSLYASVALSIRRLSPDTRHHLPALACCRGGVHILVLTALARLDVEGARHLAVEMIDTGLAEDMGGGYLRLDPGLAPYLSTQVTAAELEATQARWADATTQLAIALFSQRSQDAQSAAQLILLELPNLLALLNWLPHHESPEQTVALATGIEGLLRGLGQPRALAHAVSVRETAAMQLIGWSRVRHIATISEIERLVERGELPDALAAAQRLLSQHEVAGEDAYRGAAYDTAATILQIGLILRLGGAAEAALASADEARRRFEQLIENGARQPAQMAAMALKDIADCLRDLVLQP